MNTEITLSAEQKIRQTLTGSPTREPEFLHEGEQVVRWLTGGQLADLHVTFHPSGESIVVRCATCKVALGTIPADPYERSERGLRLSAMRQAGHEHR